MTEPQERTIVVNQTKGSPGKSAYDLAVQFDGFVGTVEDYLASLKGEQGDPGAPGAPGSAPQAYRHIQSIASAVWNVPHMLGYRPGGIYVQDSGGNQIGGFRVHHVDANNLTISFFVAGVPAATGGEAEIS